MALVKPIRTAIVVLGLLAAFPGAANAQTATAQSGGVSATLTYSGSSNTGYTSQRLVITRNGTKLFDAAPKLAACGDAACGPSGFAGDPPLRVADLDANGDPEVIYSAYTGGAHCCTVVNVYSLNAAATGYDATEHNFGDPIFRLQDLDADGRPEIVTADDRFAYLYTAYAFSYLPIQVLHFGNRAFTDVTRSFPKLISSEAKRFWRTYKRARRHTDGTQLGAIAAWAADRYRLGGRSGALKVLRRENAAGHLRGPGLHGTRFVKNLDRFLRAHGY